MSKTDPTHIVTIRWTISVAWQLVLGACFVLSMRFLIASVHAAAPTQGAVIALALGSTGVAAWRPQVALLAFILTMPFLNGLGINTLLPASQPATFVFSAIVSGLIAQRFVRFASAQLTALRRRIMGLPPKKSNLPDISRPSRYDYHMFAVAACVVLAFAIMASFACELGRNAAALGWTAFWHQPVFGFTDPYYFITGALVWIHGLVFFHELLSASRAGGLETLCGVVIRVFGVTIGIFVGLQYLLWFPPPLHVGAITTSAFFSPFEDIHSFGSFAVVGLLYTLGTWEAKSRGGLWVTTLEVCGWLALTVISWSRATWLAAIVGLVMIAALVFPRRWLVVGCLFGCAVIVVTNLNANRASWNKFSYLERFITLVRFENPAKKASNRVSLYRTALRMIGDSPLVGHGVGSFRAASVRYQAQGPEGNRPDFAHNFLLQFAAEMGIPVTVLLTAVFSTALFAGWRKVITKPVASSHTTETMGVVLALTAYLQTQLTANSLNIYPSNQFLFWFLLATLLLLSAPRAQAATINSADATE